MAGRNKRDRVQNEVGEEVMQKSYNDQIGARHN